MLRSARFRQWAGNLLAVCLGLLMLVVLAVSAEVFLRVKARLAVRDTAPAVVSRMDGSISQDGILGTEVAPNSTVHCTAIKGDTVIYDATCAIDSRGHRITPCGASGEASNVALFFGCSFTFGQGVADDETLPARYCAHAENTVSYNYGMAAYGPQQMWMQIKNLGVLEEYAGREGIIVYTFFGDHMNRLVGSPAILSQWPYPPPWLEVRDGAVEYLGTFRDRSPLQYLLYRSASRLHVARFVANRVSRMQASEKTFDRGLRLLARILQECADTAESTAPGLKFYCVLFPHSSRQWGKPLKGLLEGSNVHVLDYLELFNRTPHTMEELYFKDSAEYQWGHPKPLCYDLIARQLSRDVQGAPEDSRPAGSVAP